MQSVEQRTMKNGGRAAIALAAGGLCATALSVKICVADTQTAVQELNTWTLVDYQMPVEQIPHGLMYMAKLRENLPQDPALWSLCALALAFLFYHVWQKRPSFSRGGLLLASALFGVVEVFSLSICQLDSWSFITANGYQVMLSLLCMAGYAILMYTAGIWLFSFLDGNILRQRQPATEPPQAGRRRLALACGNVWDAHTALLAAILIGLCWMPWLVASFPGSLSWDSATQVEQFFGAEPLLAHHPLLSTALHGLTFWVGRVTGWNDYGILLYVLLQSVVSAVVYGKMVAFVKKIGGSHLLQGLVTAFFALVPVWGSYAQVVVKDTLFTAVFAWFVLMTADFLVFPKEPTEHPRRLVGYCLLALLNCLLRNNGSYAVLPCLFLTLWIVLRPQEQKRLRWFAMAGATATVLLFVGFQTIATTALQIPSDAKMEMFSIPAQQTARYLRDYADEVTPEEYANIHAVLTTDNLPEVYTPMVSDPIKNSMNWKEGTPEELQAYLQTWFSMFCKHPDCYLQATQANSCGYYSLVNTEMYHQKEEYFAYMKKDPVINAGFAVGYIFMPGTLRFFLYNYALTFDKVPLLNLFTNRGFHTWLMLLLAMYFVARRQKKLLLVMLPAVLMLLTCIASPVNDLLRYYLPILACMPIFIALALRTGGQTEATVTPPPAAQAS